MGSIYVRKGIYENCEFRVLNKLVPLDEERFEKVCKQLEPYLLSLEEVSI